MKQTQGSTPGPWRTDDTLAVNRGTFGIAIYATDTDGRTIRLANLPAGEVDPETRANSQLIAAAPDLLEACKLFQAALTEYRLRDVKKRFSLCLADAAAGKAIAKAEGIE